MLGTGDLTYQLFGECFLEAGQTGRSAQAAFEKSNAIKRQSGAADLQSGPRGRPATSSRRRRWQSWSRTSKRIARTKGPGPTNCWPTVLADLGQSGSTDRRGWRSCGPTTPTTRRSTYFLAEQYRQAGQIDKAEPLYRKLCEPQANAAADRRYQALIASAARSKRAGNELLSRCWARPWPRPAASTAGRAGKTLLADKAAVRALLAVAERTAGSRAADDSTAAGWPRPCWPWKRKQYAEANEYFELAVKTDAAKGRRADAHLGLGTAGRRANTTTRPRSFSRGIDEHVLPAENPAFHFYLAGALEMAGHTDRRSAEARRAAELQPDSARFQSRIGWILVSRQAKRRGAERSTRSSSSGSTARHDSADTRDVLHDARLVLSNIEVVAGNRMADGRRVARAGAATNIRTTSARSTTWAICGPTEDKHLERALRMIRQAVDAEPKNMAYRDSLGWALYRLGTFPEAVTELQAAAAVEKPDGVVLDHLGDALSADGEAAAADAAWTQGRGDVRQRRRSAKSKQTQDKDRPDAAKAFADQLAGRVTIRYRATESTCRLCSPGRSRRHSTINIHYIPTET